MKDPVKDIKKEDLMKPIEGQKLKKYKSALIYYRFVIRDYPRTIWANEARYGVGIVHLKQKNYENAQDMFQYLVNADVNKELKDKASEKLSDIEKHIRNIRNKKKVIQLDF